MHHHIMTDDNIIQILRLPFCDFITALRYASAVLAVVVSVRPSVSVTRRYCIKTVKLRIMQRSTYRFELVIINRLRVGHCRLTQSCNTRLFVSITLYNFSESEKLKLKLQMYC